MKVITSYGFGEIKLTEKEFSENQGTIEVILEESLPGDINRNLPKEEIYLFSNWAIARILNISAHGYFSNFQFCGSRAEAEAILVLPAPPDETKIFLDLQSGIFKTNHALGVLAQDSLLIRPWIDRWAKENTAIFESVNEARNVFKTEIKETAGTSGGIMAITHLEVENKRNMGNILGFAVIIPPPIGVAFQRKNYIER